MGRFDFVSPGAVAGDAVQRYFADLQARKQQELENSLKLQHEQRLKEQHAAQTKLQEAQLASTDEYRQVLSEGRQRATAEAQQKQDLAPFRMGDEMPSDLATKYGAWATKVPGVVTQGAQRGEDTEGVPQYDVTQGPDSFKFRGSIEERGADEAQRRMDTYVATLPPESQQAKFLAAQSATGDKTLPYQLFDDDAQNAKAIFLKKRDNTIHEMKGGQWTPFSGNALPQGAQVLNETDTDGSEGGRPYYMMFSDNTGTYMVNGRNPGEAPRRIGGIKSSSAQQQQMVDNSAALTQIELLREGFNPDWTGPLAGRYNTMQIALLDSGGDNAVAKYSARVSGLKNRFIKAITGAQMSEPEAMRIMKELPDMNLPPSTFMARLEVAEENLNLLVELQQQVYSGTRRPAENAATEKRLKELFPDTTPTGVTTSRGGNRAVPAIVAPGATPGGKRKRFNPATGKVE